jgi:hypothetical protein
VCASSDILIVLLISFFLQVMQNRYLMQNSFVS